MKCALISVMILAAALLGMGSQPAHAQVLPPQQISLEPGNGLMRVAWRVDQVPGGLKHVRVVASPSGNSCQSPDGACIVTGLRNGTAYTFALTAVTVNGYEGETAVAGPAWPCCDLPAPPVSVAAEGGNGMAVISWEPPGNVGAAGQVFTYRVSSSPSGATCETSERSCQVRELTNGVGYTFTVRAVNAVGEGSPATSGVVTPQGPPSAPTGITVYLRPKGEATITWLAPQSTGGATISRYVAKSTSDSVTCVSESELACTVRGLSNGVTYTFTVTAYNALGAGPESAASPKAKPLAGPGVPRQVSVRSSSNAATISWKAPRSTGGLALKNYVVRSSPTGSTCTTRATSCTLRGLRAGTAYAFTVQAFNAKGAGLPAQSRTIRTPSAVTAPAQNPSTSPPPPSAPEPSSPKPAPDLS